MKRAIYSKLLEWKNSPLRKPLILNGARQTGKTWVLKEFGNKEYDNIAYINCDNNAVIQQAFSDYDTERLIRVFSAAANVQIEKGSTLIFIDEIQEAPKAITALKYFYEEAKDYHIVAAGSLLGISEHTGTGYPVGKVDELTLYPMTFMEFLDALGRESLYEILKSRKYDETAVTAELYKECLRQYYFTGGMPEVINTYISTKDLLKTRSVQKRIINDYQKDFAKHIPKDLLSKVNMVWNSIPSQLAKENKKFVYGLLKTGGRAKEFEDAIEWLRDAGLIYKVNRVSKIEMPLKIHEDMGAFKLYISDMGLLAAMSDIPAAQILIGDAIFSNYTGAFTEQYVAQQLISQDNNCYYYSKDNSRLEVDFVVQKDSVIAIEVKAGENLKSKSLRSVYDNTAGVECARFSMSDYKEQDWMINVPLYAVQEWINNK